MSPPLPPPPPPPPLTSSVPGGGPHLQLVFPEPDQATRFNFYVRHSPGRLWYHRLGTGQHLLQEPGPRDVVSVHVGVHWGRGSYGEVAGEGNYGGNTFRLS